MNSGAVSVVSAMIVIAVFATSGCSKSAPPNPSAAGLAKFFVVPAISNDAKVGELVLGHTTLKQALEILPAAPDRPPAPRSEKPGPESIGKTREVVENVDLGYSPMQSPLKLLFDRNNKLVLVARTFTPAEKKEAGRIYDQHKKKLKEISKETTTILQGDVQPCVTLQVTLDRSGNPNPITYIYTCATGSS